MECKIWNPVLEEITGNKLEIVGPMLDGFLKVIKGLMLSKLSRSRMIGLMAPISISMWVLMSGCGGKTRLSMYDITRVIRIRKNNTRSRLEFVALAMSQKKEGKTDLIEFIANRGEKIVHGTLSVAWEFVNAEKALQRLKMTRIEILQQQLKCS